MAYMPLILPDFWQTILNISFMHKPHNGWHTSWGFQQTLCGNTAVCFLNCREVCRGFDFYMLTYLGRFTIRPVRALQAPSHSPDLSVEFFQREFTVLCLPTGFKHVRRILFAEYRFYDRQALATNRALIRKSVHEVPSSILLEEDPKCQYWKDLFERQLAGETLPRHDVPWYLPKSSVQQFHEQCTQAIHCAKCARAFELAHPPLTNDEALSDAESI